MQLDVVVKKFFLDAIPRFDSEKVNRKDTFHHKSLSKQLIPRLILSYTGVASFSPSKQVVSRFVGAKKFFLDTIPRFDSEKVNRKDTCTPQLKPLSK